MPPPSTVGPQRRSLRAALQGPSLATGLSREVRTLRAELSCILTVLSVPTAAGAVPSPIPRVPGTGPDSPGAGQQPASRLGRAGTVFQQVSGTTRAQRRVPCARRRDCAPCHFLSPAVSSRPCCRGGRGSFLGCSDTSRRPQLTPLLTEGGTEARGRGDTPCQAAGR